MSSRRSFCFAVAALAAGCGRSDRWIPVNAGVFAMAADDDHLYWLAGHEHSALFCARHDEGEPRMLHDDLELANELVLHDGAAFVTAHAGIIRIPFHGASGALLPGPPPKPATHYRDDPVLWDALPPGAAPQAVAEGGGYLYWADAIERAILRIPSS